ncbi:MAG: hypothetical protein HDT09_03715 [Bacteroidales bacterium]|nr:hypothetical protein [Bacteroidales bacterium]
MIELPEHQSIVDRIKKIARIRRFVIIITAFVVIGCVYIIGDTAVDINKAQWQAYRNMREAERERRELEQLQEQEREKRRWDSIQQVSQIHAIERKRLQDSVESRYALKPCGSNFTMADVERMVKNLTSDDPQAIVASGNDRSLWRVIYKKGKQFYFREFNPEKKIYGPKIKVRVIQDKKDFEFNVETRDSIQRVYTMWYHPIRHYEHIERSLHGYRVESFEFECFVNTRPRPKVELPAYDDYDEYDDEDEDEALDNEEDDLRFYYGL